MHKSWIYACEFLYPHGEGSTSKGANDHIAIDQKGSSAIDSSAQNLDLEK